MKTIIAAFSFSILLLTACNNDTSEDSNVDEDSAAAPVIPPSDNNNANLPALSDTLYENPDSERLEDSVNKSNDSSRHHK